VTKETETRRLNGNLAKLLPLAGLIITLVAMSLGALAYIHAQVNGERERAESCYVRRDAFDAVKEDVREIRSVQREFRTEQMALRKDITDDLKDLGVKIAALNK
jgi:hypothetical protein